MKSRCPIIPPSHCIRFPTYDFCVDFEFINKTTFFQIQYEGANMSTLGAQRSNRTITFKFSQKAHNVILTNIQQINLNYQLKCHKFLIFLKFQKFPISKQFDTFLLEIIIIEKLRFNSKIKKKTI